MEKLNGYDEAQAITGEFETLEAGGYICKIINAKEEKSQSGKRMLVIAFDIAEGEHKDFYKKRYENLVKSNKDPNTVIKWPNNGIYRQMLDGEYASRYLKGMMTALENSNSNFKWDWDEKKLVNLLFGGVFGREEYEGQDGKIKKATKLRWIRSVEKIRNGEFTIPEDILLEKTESNFTYNTGNEVDDLPF